MSIKKRIDYEESVPRCDKCIHYLPGGRYFVDSLPRWQINKCKLHSFTPNSVGLCRDWQGKDGSTLEKEDL